MHGRAAAQLFRRSSRTITNAVGQAEPDSITFPAKLAKTISLFHRCENERRNTQDYGGSYKGPTIFDQTNTAASPQLCSMSMSTGSPPLQSSSRNARPSSFEATANGNRFRTAAAVMDHPEVAQQPQEEDDQAFLNSSSADSSYDSTLEPASQNGRGAETQNGAVVPSGEVPDFSLSESARSASAPPWVCVVETPSEARRVAGLLCGKYKDQLFACDTETKDFDISNQSPCGHGVVICLSISGGPSLDFRDLAAHAGSNGAAVQKQDTLWIDVMLDNEEANEEIREALRPFFAAPHIRKVWHNYSFDRHVLANCGIECSGFAGDTMHMARLWDSARKGKSNYSLESLSKDNSILGGSSAWDQGKHRLHKTGMKSIFGTPNIKKDGSEGRLTVMAAMEELQTDPAKRGDWIDYSAGDAFSTWLLYDALRNKLQQTEAEYDTSIAFNTAEPPHSIGDSLPATTSNGAAVQSSPPSLWTFYNNYWRPFGELLTDMESEGFLVDREHLREGELKAKQDQEAARAAFKDWASALVPGARLMNVSSGAQIQQLFFAGTPNQDQAKGNLPLERTFKMPNVEGVIEEGKKAPKKNLDVALWSLWGQGATSPLMPEIHTPTGWPATSTVVMRSLAGKPGAARKAYNEKYGNAAEEVTTVADEDEEVIPQWATSDAAINDGQQLHQDPRVLEMEAEGKRKGFGKLYAYFRLNEKAGLEACQAVDSLCEMGAIDTLLSNFLEPLQHGNIATRDPETGELGRVHCSLNINTETGRLSCRRPNLQNQPAHEKDKKYKVRKAFTADVARGNTLIVADYGQLELRVLAHMAKCSSMVEAFRLGGDFHSRTALGMYDHIQQAVRDGDCLEEWDGGPNGDQPPPKPLVKDMFGGERRKAKVLNFSIAYGKTAHGLSRDWGVTLEEAEKTVDRWYASRPEVRDWQKRQQRQAQEKGYVSTILGRRRQLPDATVKKGGKAKGHAMRAAINTPIQGSAADIATAAMLTIAANARLKELDWKLLLQVHDEVILEGPKESVEEAERIVRECMMKPFNGQGLTEVELIVDSKHADTWFEAK
ncbi:hypothetical protein WJX73_004973 [Symbiochloris irregularis]|uniref:DNA-directed DNA polymerase family A palm domain-containing protein n=1 Tax=Symbiochloris irregularis TaxID=706552 RepID=A0AAW1NQ05_9CHLO